MAGKRREASVRGFLKIGQDVTERRRREEQLQASEERFRQFGEHSSDAIWIRNAETLVMEYVSPAFELLYGMSRQELRGGDTVARWLERIHPEDREAALENIKSVRGGRRISHDFRISRLSDGKPRWIENTDFPTTDDAGRVQLIAGIVKDITDSKASAERSGSSADRSSGRPDGRSSGRRDGDVNAVTVRDLKSFIHWFQGLELAVVQH